MARNISIAISAKDDFSQAINTMKNSCSYFSKDVEGLTRKLESLNDTKVVLKVDTDDARRKLLEAQKEYEKLGTAASKAELLTANASFEQSRRNLSLVGNEARQTEKDLVNFSNTYSKTENRASGMSSLLKGIATAGIGNMLGSSVVDAAKTGITSALGNRTGDALSTTLSGALTGAVMGNAMGSVGGVPGAVIGGAIGTAAGGISAATQWFQKDDDAYRELVQQQFSQLTEKEAADVAAGSALTAQRQVDKIAFSRMLGGEGEANDYLSWARTTANDTPFLYDDIAQMSKTLGSYGYDPERMKEMIVAIGDTGAALGAETYDMQMMIKGLGRIKQSGKTNLEYLNPMIERGVPVWDYLREGLSKDAGRELTVEEVQKMSSLNQIDGNRAVEILIDMFQQNYGGMMDEQSKTYSGLQSTLQGWEQENQAAYGEGYTSVRSSGIADQNEYFEGDGGEAIREANRCKGQLLAQQENAKEEFQRNAQTSIMTGNIDESFDHEGNEKVVQRLQELAEAYKAAQKERDKWSRRIADGRMSEADREEAEMKLFAAGAKMGDLLQEGGILGQNEYTASEGAQLLLQSQLDLIGGIQVDAALNSSYYMTGTKLSNQLAKGIIEGIRNYRPAISAELGYLNNYLTGDSPPITTGTGSSYAANSGGGVPPGRAFGVQYVPRDDYLARLHEGERVLTASEARAFRQSAPPVTITGNSFAVREEADIYKIAQALAEELNRAQMIS